MSTQILETTDVQDVAESRSLDAIQRDLKALEDDGLPTPDLDTVRRSARMHLSGVAEGGDAWQSIVDEFEPELDRHERGAISKLEGLRTSILRDRQTLSDVPYRCGLPADQASAAEAKAARLASRLSSMSAVDVQRAIRGAVLFGDKTELAAWAMLGPDLETRFPKSERVRDDRGQMVLPQTLLGDLMRQCEAKTGDRAVAEARERIETQLQRVNEKISDIARARNQHNPTGGVGGVLASYQFGRNGDAEQVRAQRRHDPAAVRARLGR